MTTPIEDLRQWLLAQPALVSLVSDRVYWLRAPQQDPADVFQPFVILRIAEQREHEETLSEMVTTWQARVQAACYAESLPGAHQIADALFTALHMQTNNANVAFPFESSRFSQLEEFFDEDQGVFRVDVEFLIVFTD